jgi:hypothetical protein
LRTADRIETMNNTGFQAARKAADLSAVRIHDLRHTFGQRLREAGMPAEDRPCCWGTPSNSAGPGHIESAKLVGALARVFGSVCQFN